jgi:hypothetical protein
MLPPELASSRQQGNRHGVDKSALFRQYPKTQQPEGLRAGQFEGIAPYGDIQQTHQLASPHSQEHSMLLPLYGPQAGRSF